MKTQRDSSERVFQNRIKAHDHRLLATVVQGVDAVAQYIHQALQELADQQVRYAPPPRRLEQLKRAEQLLTELNPEREYPYQFICFRVTDFRAESYPGLLLKGQDVIHDLGLWINALAKSLPAIPVEDVTEPVLSLEEISKKLNVTTKTINRWRKRGLIGIPVVSTAVGRSASSIRWWIPS